MLKVIISYLLAPLLLIGAVHAQETRTASASGNQPQEDMIQGSDGVPLSVQEWGNPAGVPVLLIHGFGFSSVIWKNQIGELAKTARIIAVDLRGHGFSGKPWTMEAYSGRKIWAQDIAAVIKAKKLDRPVIVGWSFGGYVALNYLRTFGTNKSRGLLLTGSLAGLVEAPPPVDPEDFGMPKHKGDSRVDNYHLFFDELEWTARVMTAAKPDPRTMLQKQLSLAMTPPYVRRAMTGIELDNQDFASKMKLPVLLIYGKEDGSIPASYIDKMVNILPHAKAIGYENAGHTPFAEQPDRFNADLLAFVNAPCAALSASKD